MEADWVLNALHFPMGRKQADQLTAKIGAEGYPAERLIALSFYHVKEVAFRAAWVMEHLEEQFPGAYLPYLDLLLTEYIRQENNSCRRHYTKLMMRFTSADGKNPYHEPMRRANLEDIVGVTFDWLIHPSTPVAVQANCIDVLANLRKRYDWLTDELRMHIPFLLVNGTAAMQSRGKKLLKAIDNER